MFPKKTEINKPFKTKLVQHLSGIEKKELQQNTEKVTLSNTLRQDTLNDNMHDIFTIMNILKEKIPSEYSEELEYLYIEHLLRSASLRYINYPNGEHYIQKISDIMHKEYPNYQNNKYYKNVNYRFKLVCSLAYHKNYLLLKMFNKLNNIKTNI